MRGPIRSWLVGAAACTALTTLAACSPPQSSKNSPVAHASPSVQPATLNGGWSSAGTMSTERYGGMVGVLLQGGRVLVTGASTGGQEIGNVDVYDPVSGWSVGPKLPSDLPGAVAAPLPNGRALLAGGFPDLGGHDGPGPGPLATAMTYNPAAGTWTKAPNMSTARAYATATALRDGRVLVAGGYDRRVILLTNPTREGVQLVPLAGSLIFNSTSSTWTAGPALAHARYGHLAVALQGGRVLVVGGNDPLHPEQLLTSAELFDSATRSWTSAGALGAGRSQFTLTALVDGRALLTGGIAADGRTVLSSTLIYDPTKNQWSPGPDLASARSGHGAAILADGRLLVSVGADQAGRLASSELFDAAGNSWSATGALETARSNHLAISLSNGRILVIGGSGSSDALTSSELFDASAKGMPATPRASAGPGHWQLGATKPIPTDSYTGSSQLLPDGRVLLVPRYGSADFQLYDPKLDAWTTPFSRKPPPCNTCGIGQPSPPLFLAAPLGSDKVLLLTVDPQQVVAGKAEIVDLKTGTAALAASPGKIGQSRLDLLPDGRVWLTALQQGDRHAKLYDPTANRWTATSDVPLGLAESGADMQTITAVPGGRVLVVGSRTAMVYDPASGGWADAGSFPGPWSQFSATGLASGDVLLAGGTVFTGATPDGAPIQAVNSKVMRWDHTTGKLVSAVSMPVGLYYQSAALLADGRVLLAGGSDAVGVHTSADPVTRAEIYDPVARSWSVAAPLPVARYQAIAVTLADRRVLLVGGYGMGLGVLYPGDAQPSLLFTPQP